jgi:hypothetical protein
MGVGGMIVIHEGMKLSHWNPLLYII